MRLPSRDFKTISVDPEEPDLSSAAFLCRAFFVDLLRWLVSKVSSGPVADTFMTGLHPAYHNGECNGNHMRAYHKG